MEARNVVFTIGMQLFPRTRCRGMRCRPRDWEAQRATPQENVRRYCHSCVASLLQLQPPEDGKGLIAPLSSSSAPPNALGVHGIKVRVNVRVVRACC